jgi:hypothetical protein
MNWLPLVVGLGPLLAGVLLGVYLTTRSSFRAQSDLRKRLVLFLLLVAVVGFEIALLPAVGWPIAHHALIGAAIPIVVLALILFLPGGHGAAGPQGSDAHWPRIVALGLLMLVGFVGSAGFAGPQHFTMLGVGVIALALFAMQLLRMARA